MCKSAVIGLNHTPKGRITMEEKKKKNYVVPVIGALIAVVACVAYIVMKFASQQQQLEDKWSEYDDCGWM